MEKIGFEKMEEKWMKRWEEEKIFEPKIEKEKEKFFITAAYPYVQAPQHIGHARTYSTADVYARFMRMLGYNVLFPMGWHITGTPIIAISKRIKENDESLIKLYKNVFNVPEDVIKTFENPENLINYFIQEIKYGMKRMGFSIDWGREFNTGDKRYNKFIEWQFLKLYEKGLLKKGKHPVLWCPNCENPVGEHDVLEDKKAKIEEFTIIKFYLDDKILPAATLRPETIFGVTNLWVNPNEYYVELKIDNENWIVSEKAAKKLKLQKENVEEIKKIKGEELIGKEVFVPIIEKKIKILPASFVDANNATGVVYSCPAHAPYDWIALKDLGNMFNANEIKPISIIKSKNYGEFPAIEICEKYKIKNQNDERLEKITQELYLNEFKYGITNEKTGKYSGMKVSEARDAVKKELIEKNYADVFFEIMNKPIICRCNTECVVKVIKDQWFIDYANEEWKKISKDWLNEMKIIPESLKEEYHNAIEWLHERACARKRGFGTRLPFDKNWIIESLSDSTIYMAYYTIAKIINENNIDAEKLLPEVFDFVFLGKGDLKEISKISGLNENIIKEMRESFLYWYPLDSRHSGTDLITNHLIFFIMNHIAIFPKEFWPKQIVTNGFVLNEGKKMSKSLGNIVPLKEALDKYGADVIRFLLLFGANLDQDTNFTENIAKSIENKIKEIFEMVNNVENCDDKWIRSRLAYCRDYVTNAMKELRFRDASNYLLFIFGDEVKWHIKKNKKISRFVFENWIKMLSPFIPYTSEEIWEMLGNKGFISKERWPEKMERDIEAETEERYIMNLIEDIKNVIKLSKKEKVEKIYIQVAEKEKYNIFEMLNKNKEEALKISKDKKIVEIMIKFMKNNNYFFDENKNLIILDEKNVIERNKSFIEKEIGANIEIIESAEGVSEKEKIAIPYKPAIYVV